MLQADSGGAMRWPGKASQPDHPDGLHCRCHRTPRLSTAKTSPWPGPRLAAATGLLPASGRCSARLCCSPATRFPLANWLGMLTGDGDLDPGARVLHPLPDADHDRSTVFPRARSTNSAVALPRLGRYHFCACFDVRRSSYTDDSAKSTIATAVGDVQAST